MAIWMVPADLGLVKIGNNAYATWTVNGDGATTLFVLYGCYPNAPNLTITDNGSPVPDSDYTLGSDGNSVQFGSAPASGHSLVFQYAGPFGRISSGFMPPSMPLTFLDNSDAAQGTQLTFDGAVGKLVWSAWQVDEISVSGLGPYSLSQTPIDGARQDVHTNAGWEPPANWSIDAATQTFSFASGYDASQVSTVWVGYYYAV